jgi:type I restriction enzyme R subunit
MSDFDVKEKRFEEDIEDYLTHHGGYTKGDPKKFNRESGLEEDTFVEFIKTSQPKKWERYVKIYAENSEKQIIERFKREVKTTNLLNVMRHGFMDRGIKFYPIFWKPETSLNETTQMQYDANILHCTRQLHYSVHNENSIDIVLFANGIPVVSMELKCQFTGQDTTNAINQYKFDRAGKLLDELAAQGMHKNLSFFAFTATPKGKTLQLFGQKDAEGIYRPFHIYSMRQAIEEHFILDVLQNYMTYKMYYKIAKIIEDNPEFDTTAGSKAIINYETLHPHNISQKTAIMLEHFMNVTRHKIGGRAKAMVVTPSRLHAVRYVQEFKRQIKEKGLNDLEVLVAFSGEVKDNDDVFTEEGMNKDKEGKTIKEKALPETFHADDYGILVVAEKYQTGFDEPLLHTMFVDKKLSGVKAVQTLSRLNRTTRGKVDTFVLDFVNSAEDIKASFEPFYEETVLLEETDPNVVYDMKNTLDDFRVYQKSEVDKFADIFYQNENQSAGDLGKLQGQLRPAIDRYEVLEVEKQDIFKSTLASFNRVYAYITQVCRLFDKDIHRFSIYSKFLYTMLPKGHGGEKINIDDKVLLEYYKLEKDFEGPIELESTEGGYTPISGDSGHREPKKDPLTVIIDKINEKYGTHFTEMDKVLVQMENDYANQEKWQSYAKNNDRATFMLLFEKDFPNMAADRYEQNDQFFRKLFDDPDMMRQVMETVGSVLYERLKKKYIFDPKSGVIEEATPETYVEDTYLTKK